MRARGREAAGLALWGKRVLTASRHTTIRPAKGRRVLGTVGGCVGGTEGGGGGGRGESDDGGFGWGRPRRRL